MTVPYITEQELIQCGLGEDDAFEVSRTIVEDEAQPVHELLRPDSQQIAHLYNLTEGNTDKLSAYLSYLGGISLDTEKSDGSWGYHDAAVAGLRASVTRTTATARFFDQEFEQNARRRSFEEQIPIDMAKFRAYRDHGINSNDVVHTEIDSTRKRLVHSLTTRAFIDSGFPVDHDQLPVMKLIETNPTQVKDLCEVGLYGQALRLYACMVVDGLLNPEQISEKYPKLTDNQALLIWGHAEQLMGFAVSVAGHRAQPENEDTNLTIMEGILDQFLEVATTDYNQDYTVLISKLIGDNFTSKEISDYLQVRTRRSKNKEATYKNLQSKFGFNFPLNAKDGVTLDISV